MLKKWTPELDSILLQGVFEECKISVGRMLCEKIAGRIRATGIEGFTECTPKAVENRLYNWKKKNIKTDATSSDAAVSTPKKVPAPKIAAVTPKTPHTKKSATKKKTGSDEADGDGDVLMSFSAGRKRASESEERAKGKKAKVKPLDTRGLDEVRGEDGE